MLESDPKQFHKIYGARSPRLAYRNGDFLDYMLMLVLCVAAMAAAYGPRSIVTGIGTAICALMALAFAMRHGCALKTPLILKRPQDIAYMLLYRIQNMKAAYVFAAAFLALENCLIYLTPGLPHEVRAMRLIAFGLFYSHLAAITAYRTAILVAHLRNAERVREFLSQTAWKGALLRQPRISLEIWHAYFTGILAHIILIAPWYMVIKYCNFSVIFLPLTCLVNVITQKRFLKVLNLWFYRDHWLCHNCELEFVYLHGSHHDAIPSGLIGVSGNGFLEGFLRHAAGAPGPFYNPLITFAVYGFEVKGDIDGHQFIPGVYPHVPIEFQRINQHSTHHFARLEPYSFGLWLDQPGVSDAVRNGLKFLPDEIRNAIALDEKLTGFKWHNPRYERYLELYGRYANEGGAAAAESAQATAASDDAAGRSAAGLAR